MAHTVFALLVAARNRFDVSLLVMGQMEQLFRREDHMTNSLLSSSHAQGRKPKPDACDSTNPGVCHRLGSLPGTGMSQLHVQCGLEGWISNHSHDEALIRPRQRRCTASRERRQGRLQRPAMPFEALAPTATQHKQPALRTCSRFTRSQAQSGPGCHAGMHLSSASTPSPTASDQDARVSS